MPAKLSTSEILDRARAGTEAAHVGRVFGAPIERDGVTIVPVAVVIGGAGGGSGSGTAPGDSPGRSPARSPGNPANGSPGDSTDAGTAEGEGSGGGFGFVAYPSGVYVIRNGAVRWRPALDVNKLVQSGQLVAIIALLVARSVLRGRRR